MTMLHGVTAVVAPNAPPAAGKSGQASAEETAGFAEAMQAANADPAPEGAGPSGAAPAVRADAVRADAVQRADGGAPVVGKAPAPEETGPVRAQGGKPVQPTAASDAIASGKAGATEQTGTEAPGDGDEPDRDDQTVADAADPVQPPVMIVPSQPAPTSTAVETDRIATDGVAATDPATGATHAPASQPVLPGTGAPATAEAAALLQLVRDHMRGVAGQGGDGSPADDPVASVPDGTADAGQATGSSSTMIAPAPSQQGGAQTSVQGGAALPTVDLSASLGDRMVDMGVSGQWLDGLARDIAGLSARGAQGRFQINTDQLGQVQVDIRQGAEGAAVSLTVLTEAAEQALRQDSDRLKLDAGLSAVRISEVKVERAPQIAEAARPDTAGNQSGAQQQGQAAGQGHAAGQGMGQSSAQSQMRGRGQARENIAPVHKGSGDAAVLNHEQTGDAGADLPRARYA
ncbi:flagellar hook-length control protein FliK [Sphingobium sp. HBC34]|uniref:Flagellar hook-length control protein FliK n=1 Tax=Sphingobium cyanobacteriorum TaxID=3063954 RepID=A0ABT8ZHS0_9SPHN|nr:flagellar hook-length control protein FliK [Sphingobium sp. HBC34]MDO7834079.1 flagellar hook-length control protein FliK [Sphingobium sp. HBC34]